MTVSDRSFVLLNAIMFQLAWWTLVLWGNSALWFGVSLLVVHFLLSPQRRSDVKLLLGVTLMGAAVDFCLIWLDVLRFTDLPWWLLALWMHFSLTFNASLQFLQRWPLWSHMLLGAIFGSGSYLAGATLGAVILPLGAGFSVIALALCWSLLLPAGVRIAALSRHDVHLDGADGRYDFHQIQANSSPYKPQHKHRQQDGAGQS